VCRGDAAGDGDRRTGWQLVEDRRVDLRGWAGGGGGGGGGGSGRLQPSEEGVGVEPVGGRDVGLDVRGQAPVDGQVHGRLCDRVPSPIGRDAAA